MRNCLVDHRESALLSKRLVTIKTDCELGVDLDSLRFDPEKSLRDARLVDFCREWEFRSIVKRLEAPSPVEEGKAADETATTETHQYRCIRTQQELQELLAELNSSDRFAFDTETTGLDIVTDRPIGISFATQPGRAYYVPLVQQHLDPDLKLEDVIQQLAPPLQDRTKLKIAHNLKFDLQMLDNLTLPVSALTATPC